MLKSSKTRVTYWRRLTESTILYVILNPVKDYQDADSRVYPYPSGKSLVHTNSYADWLRDLQLDDNLFFLRGKLKLSTRFPINSINLPSVTRNFIHQHVQLGTCCHKAIIKAYVEVSVRFESHFEKCASSPAIRCRHYKNIAAKLCV